MIVPDLTARRRLLDERTRRLERAMRAKLAEDSALNARLLRAFGDPRLLIASAQQRIDELMLRLTRTMQRRLAVEKDAATKLTTELRAQHPQVRIARDRARLSDLDGRLVAAMIVAAKEKQARATMLEERLVRTDLVRQRGDIIAKLAGRLDAMSPLKVLARGYAIVSRNGHAIRDAAEVVPGDNVHVRVGTGEFDAEVRRGGRGK
jgi:exodeoxyribonuclease VII large subunit